MFIGEDLSPSIYVRFVGLRVYNKQSMLNWFVETAHSFRYAYISLQKLCYFYQLPFSKKKKKSLLRFLVEQCIINPASSKWRVGAIKNTEDVTKCVTVMLLSWLATCVSSLFIHFRHEWTHAALEFALVAIIVHLFYTFVRNAI